MKKSFKSLLIIFALFVSLFSSHQAFAETGEVGEVSGRDQSALVRDQDENENNDTDDNSSENENKKNSNANANREKNEKSIITGDQHKSFVAKFVESLNKVADSDKKIGEQVREIAKAQHENDENVANAVDEVQNRGKFKTFLIDTDYKNIGKIRSESVNTEQRIEKLQKLVDQATTQSVKDSLLAEIAAIKAEQVKLDTFIKQHESTFSLFGWFAKLFTR